MEIDSIFENVKYVGANEKKTNVTIGLRFPYSTPAFRGGYKKTNFTTEICGLTDVYCLSFNEAMKSEFLKQILYDLPDNVCYCEIEVPRSLYADIRLIDIYCLHNIWTGRFTIDHVYIHDDLYSLIDISRLADALMLSHEMPWYRSLLCKKQIKKINDETYLQYPSSFLDNAH